MNLVAICMNIFLPWFLFSAIYAITSFTFHYQHPTLTWVIVLIGFGASIATGFLAYRAKKRDRDPSWYTFAALAFFLAVVLAAVFGDMNFWYNMQPFYDIENLNTYPSVNPAREKGQQLMDAGRVYFADGTGLDMKKAMGFKNLDLYCVAPIVNGNNQLASYDFWAVGINCCSGVSSDFRCGEFNNPHARSGLRLMRDDQRPFWPGDLNISTATVRLWSGSTWRSQSIPKSRQPLTALSMKLWLKGPFVMLPTFKEYSTM